MQDDSESPTRWCRLGRCVHGLAAEYWPDVGAAPEEGGGGPPLQEDNPVAKLENMLEELVAVMKNEERVPIDLCWWC